MGIATVVESPARAAIGRARPALADALAVAGPALLVGLLCAYKLADRSLWLDESATISIASQHGHALWAAIAHDGGNMFAYYLLMHGVIALFGDGAAVIRLPSVLGTALTAGMTVVLGLRLFSRRSIAVGAGVLFALSLPTVFWGQDARGYALMVTFATGAFLAFVEILRTPPSRPVSPWALGAYGTCTVLALYSGYDAVLMVPVQLVILWAFPERTRAVLGCLAAAALCCLPLLALAFARGSGQLFWVPPLTAHVLGQTGMTLFSTGMPPNFHERLLSTPGAILSLAVLLFAVLSALRSWNGRRVAATDGTWTVLLCTAWVVVPAVLGLAAAVVGKPIELARCTVLVMPGLALLLSWALLRDSMPRLLGLGLFAALLVVRWLPLSASYGVSPENWKAATSYVVSVSARQGACVMFYPQDGRMAFDYYVRQGEGSGTGLAGVGAAAGGLASAATEGAAGGAAQGAAGGATEGAAGAVGAARRVVPVLPTLGWGSVKPFVEQYAVPSRTQLRSIIASCPRLWLISSHEGQSDGPRLSGQNYVRYQRLVSQLGWVYPHQNLVQFGYAATVYAWQLSKTPIG